MVPMSFVQATPEFVAAAATDLARIGSTISSANTAALGPTSGVLAPGADEVSASIAALFDAHSQVYQALSAQAAAFHSQFVQLMNGGALQYAVTEAANTTPLQSAATDAGGQRRGGRFGADGTRGPPGGGGGAGSCAATPGPAGPARVATPAYAPAGSPSPVQPAASSAPAPAGTPAAAAQPEAAPQTSAGPALPVSARPAPHAPAQAQPATAPVRRVPIVPPESG
ncbi:hypothetical protein PICSAR235_01360 [Mycobacterium avium subsp. paratuberculosis]|nr:hypothetical protein PICSAR235_01360 [Mycobacterium avium subsp. paratuberculosis]